MQFGSSHFGIAATAAMLFLATASPLAAADLSGSWRGGGTVSFASGKGERAKCRASFSRVSGTSYAMSATCATASGSVTQQATLRQVGANSYRGSFYNPEWDTSGSISVRVAGRSLSANVSATKGSASMHLSR
jgi:hypothetical protein